MTGLCKFIVRALIAFLVSQISVADERLVEGEEKAVVNLKTSAATSNPEKKMICKKIKGTYIILFLFYFIKLCLKRLRNSIKIFLSL